MGVNALGAGVGHGRVLSDNQHGDERLIVAGKGVAVRALLNEMTSLLLLALHSRGLSVLIY